MIIGHHSKETYSEKQASGPGFIAYLLILMWFLLTVMAANTAQAQEAVPSSTHIVLTAADILPQIEKALTEKGMAPGTDIILKDPQQSFATLGDITIAYASFNERSGRFVIRLAGVAAAIAGSAQSNAIFPMLARSIARGDIIQEKDIVFVVAANAHGDLYIHDAEDLIGKEARRPLRAQYPLRASDVSTPVLIKKGALVTLTYDIEGLRLSHQGIALGAGGVGDVITVRNVQSDRVLRAVINGENVARVTAPRAHQTTLEG